MALKSGQVVTIYHDPVTQTQVEAPAKLIRYIGPTDGDLEYWTVAFDTLDAQWSEECDRWVSTS